MFLVEPSYTVFTHVQWEGARGSTHGAACDCAALRGSDCILSCSLLLAHPLNGGHHAVYMLLGNTRLNSVGVYECTHPLVC